jgi:hypothetical protein
MIMNLWILFLSYNFIQLFIYEKEIIRALKVGHVYHTGTPHFITYKNIMNTFGSVAEYSGGT